MRRAQPRDVITQPRHGYAKVRELGPSGWGQPYMYDRLRKRLLPYRCDEWWRSPAGLWMPAIMGGAGVAQENRYRQTAVSMYPAVSGLGISTLALDSAYTAGTGGDAVGSRLSFPETFPLNTVYFLLDSYGGTAANVTTLNLQLLAWSNGATIDTGTIIEAKEVNPNSQTGWLASTGWTSDLTKGVLYCVVVGDANGNGTDFARVAYRVTSALLLRTWMIASVFTNAGFTTFTREDHTPPIVLKSDSGVVAGGHPFSAQVNTASDALQKGLRIASGLRGGLGIYAVGFSTGTATTLTGLNIYEGDAGPVSGAAHQSTLVVPEFTATRTAAVFTDSAPYEIPVATPLSIALTFSGSTAMPTYAIGTGANADLRKQMPGRGDWHTRVEVSGTPNTWSDDQDSFPMVSLFVDDLVEAGGGGGVNTSITPRGAIKLGSVV